MKNLITALLLAIFVIGCDSGSKPTATLNTTTTTPSKIADNSVCPIMGGKVKADAPTVSFEGQTIGFCCEGCDTKWNALSNEEKEEKLAEANANS